MTNLLEGSKTVKPKITKVESVAEFSEAALQHDDIWEHAFDESNEIEIPKYLDNPIKTGLDYWITSSVTQGSTPLSVPFLLVTRAVVRPP